MVEKRAQTGSQVTPRTNCTAPDFRQGRLWMPMAVAAPFWGHSQGTQSRADPRFSSSIPPYSRGPGSSGAGGKPKEEGMKTALDAKCGAELLLPGFIYSLVTH